MPVYKNEKEYFWGNIENNTEYEKYPEMCKLLKEHEISALAVADRLGHEKVETTLNTYSHLFPHKRDEVAEKLQKLK